MHQGSEQSETRKLTPPDTRTENIDVIIAISWLPNHLICWTGKTVGVYAIVTGICRNPVDRLGKAATRQSGRFRERHRCVVVVVTSCDMACDVKFDVATIVLEFRIFLGRNAFLGVSSLTFYFFRMTAFDATILLFWYPFSEVGHRCVNQRKSNLNSGAY